MYVHVHVHVLYMHVSQSFISDFFLQSLYVLGTQFFLNDDFAAAHDAFLKCNDHYNSLSPDQHPPFFNVSQLRGFLVACDGAADKKDSAAEKMEENRGNLLNKIEKLRLNDDFEGVGQVLLDDLKNREIPSVVIGAIEREVTDWSDTSAAMETQPKRPRLTQPDFSSSIALINRVCLCNGLRNVMEGKSPRCHFWQLLSEEKGCHLEYVLHVSNLTSLINLCSPSK